MPHARIVEMHFSLGFCSFGLTLSDISVPTGAETIVFIERGGGVWGTAHTQTCTKLSHSYICYATATCNFKMLLWLEPGEQFRKSICLNLAFVDKRSAKRTSGFGPKSLLRNPRFQAAPPETGQGHLSE